MVEWSVVVVLCVLSFMLGGCFMKWVVLKLHSVGYRITNEGRFEKNPFQ